MGPKAMLRQDLAQTGAKRSTAKPVIVSILQSRVYMSRLWSMPVFLSPGL